MVRVVCSRTVLRKERLSGLKPELQSGDGEADVRGEDQARKVFRVWIPDSGCVSESNCDPNNCTVNV